MFTMKMVATGSEPLAFSKQHRVLSYKIENKRHLHVLSARNQNATLSPSFLATDYLTFVSEHLTYERTARRLQLLHDFVT
jgi:hypothetical protein